MLCCVVHRCLVLSTKLDCVVMCLDQGDALVVTIVLTPTPRMSWRGEEANHMIPDHTLTHRYRVISQQNRGKTKMQQTLPEKPRTSPLAYKPPINLTTSLPVTQSYQPPAYYSDPAVYSPDHDPHMSQYSGEQLVSRGAPAKPSPPSTSTFHELQMTGAGYSGDVYMHNMATKYESFKEQPNPSIFTNTGTSMLAGSYGNSEVRILLL